MTSPIQAAIGSAAAQAVPLASAAPASVAASIPGNAVQAIQASQAAAVVSLSDESKKDSPNIEKKTDAQFGSQDLANDGSGKGGGGGATDDEDEEANAAASQQPVAAKKHLDISA